MTYYIGDETRVSVTVAKRMLEHAMHIYIDRNGERRTMPFSVARNAIRMLESFQAAVDAGVLGEVPEYAKWIGWDSCLGIPEAPEPVEPRSSSAQSTQVQVCGDEALDVIEAESHARAQ